ncbi:hypothetical protein HK405_007532 [Cladochytrium tenue]|nr:hypothetical protein HK405_007532 [Cladochytrium tenue]
MNLPHRQIRALFDDETVTVYQAYSDSIALAAVATQRLNASPDFKMSRTTWIKPSWCWMMYRSGYARKDPRQARILAIRIRREGFIRLLDSARLSNHGRNDGEAIQGNGVGYVVVQWDPERGPRLEKLSSPGADVRSIQIGIGPALVGRWIEEWIVGIEDATERAHALESAVRERPDVSAGQLRDMGLIPDEREFCVPPSVQTRLGMAHPC